MQTRCPLACHPGATLTALPAHARAQHTHATQGFQRLFSYIQGANADGVAIPMTAPVTVAVTPGPGPTCGTDFTVSFFVPPGAAPPAPTSPALFVRAERSADVYVATFGGWADEKEVIKHAAALAATLAAAGVHVAAAGGFTTAGYDSPFRLLERHNEIWFAATAPPDALPQGSYVGAH